MHLEMINFWGKHGLVVLQCHQLKRNTGCQINLTGPMLLLPHVSIKPCHRATRLSRWHDASKCSRYGSLHSKTNCVSQLGDFCACSMVWTFKMPKQSNKTKNPLVGHIKEKINQWARFWSRENTFQGQVLETQMNSSHSPLWSLQTLTPHKQRIQPSQITNTQCQNRASSSAKTPTNRIFSDLVTAELNRDTLSSNDVITTRKSHVQFALHLMFLDDVILSSYFVYN